MTTKNIYNILEHTYGYKKFRPQQEEIINHVLNKKDALVIMPTGGGKSMCFQIPALASKGITLVVSPLIALMNDQVTALQEMGVAAEALHSNSSPEQIFAIDDRLKKGDLKLLYMSPERINTEQTQRFLSTLDIALIAIDEAHCVSVWGNDFRPDYAKLASLRNIFPKAAILALTATADNATQADIRNQLQLRDPKTFLSSFERKNITTYIEGGTKRLDRISSILGKHLGDCGIIYCLSRKDTEKVAKKLSDSGYSASYYHAGMAGDKRAKIQRQFQNDEIRIICATIAFGMGIDKPNIRFVIHYNMPKNLEAYYQEIGRGGRDGNKSVAYMFSSWGDYIMLKGFIDNGEAKAAFKEVQTAKLNRMWEFSTSSDCRTNLVLNYFGEYKSENCGHCDNCIHPPTTKDGTIQTMMALSAIKRCQEKIGIELLIDILRGSQKAEIISKAYDQIKTFGIGRDISRLNWKNYIIQMVNQGVISIDYTNGSILKWTPLSINVIEDKLKVNILDFQPRKKDLKKIKFASIPLEIDANLLGTLKNWRKQKAKEKNTPAYIIFSNKVLDEICHHLPKTKQDLLRINGIGDTKLNLYGDDILQMVKENA